MTKDSKWELDRVPTKRERMLGVVLSAAILLFFSFILYASGSKYLTDESSNKSLVSVFVTLTLFFGSLILFARATFSKSRKPSKRAIRNTAYTLFSLSCAMIVLPLFVGLTPQAFYMIAIGLTGIGGSKIILNRGALSEGS
jgi:divalent metal cation (Fe/Co/Zn/Cd) transporter